MKREFAHVSLLLKRLGIALLLFSACRAMFLALNYSYFNDLAASELLPLFIHGLRFDLSAIVYLNIPFIFLHLIPLPQRDTQGYQKFLKFLFYLTLIPALFVNCADFVYYRFTFKRMTADIFSLVSTGSDFMNLFPRFVRDYFYLVIIWVALLALAEFLYRRVRLPLTEKPPLHIFARALLQLIILGTFSGLAVIAARGGLQLKPIAVITAAQYAHAREVPIVLNTPFSILRTLGKKDLQDVNYFPPEELAKRYSPLHPGQKGEFRPLNVVVIVLESFAREFVGSLNGNEGYTPFLDSLIDKGLVFEHAFANGKNSVDAIPAVFASLPSLMKSSYIFSTYVGNQITSLPNLLKGQGYTSAFYHGGENGSMGFDVFARMAGFDKYYGRTEYNNEADFDGNWGIYDEPFLQYVATNLNTTPQPFFTGIFTLSSHHPYNIPELYQGKFRAGPLKIQQSLGYTDFALKRFFETAAKAPWFDNTLFVIVADHTPEPETDEYQSSVGIYEIPILFYRPNGELKGKRSELFQQIDIMPTVLDMLKFPREYFAFGRSAFDKRGPRSAINYLSGIYQYLEKDLALHSSGDDVLGLFNYKLDPFLKQDLQEVEPQAAEELANGLKAFIQTYNSALIHNRLVAPTASNPNRRTDNSKP